MLLRRLLPDAEEGIAYGAPAYRVNGKVIAGFTASSSTCRTCPTAARSWPGSATPSPATRPRRGALRFPLDEPLPETLVEQLVAARRAEIR